MALFDRYVIVDWSAAATPKRGRDSIWLAVAGGDGAIIGPENWATRSEALLRIRELIEQSLAAGYRMLMGFDFAFGYPRGAAGRLSGENSWRHLWKTLADKITDQHDNKNNSYELAAEFNRTAFPETGAGPFWGHPQQHVGRYDGLDIKKNRTAFAHVPEYRHVERHAKGAKSVWQLAYNGTVGRQAMLGIAALQQLRQLPAFAEYCAIWPFETGFADDLSKSVIIAEVYPSLFPVDERKGEVRDAAQVRTLAESFLAYDRTDELGRLLAVPSGLDPEIVSDVVREEGWIVGAGHSR